MTDAKPENLSLTYKKFGLKGLLSKVDLLSKENFLLKLILDIDKKHFVAVKFLKDLVNIEKDVSVYGTRKQAEKLIKKLKIDTVVYSDITNKDFQNQGGLLIYGVNHNAFIEPVILFSLLKQKRIKLMLYRMYCFWGKNIRRLSLPVSARNYPNDKISRIRKLYDLSQGFRKSENLTDSQLIKMNEKKYNICGKIA